MIFRRDRLVKRSGPGQFAINFPPDIRDFLVHLGTELDEARDTSNPALQRLFPTAYAHDAERDAGYQVFAQDALIEQRTAAIAQLTATAHETSIDSDALTSWMKVINDARLVLGTMLDVSEDADAPRDPTQDETFDVYELLGLLLSEIIDALQDDLAR